MGSAGNNQRLYQEGDVLLCYYERAQKRKYAVNLEPAHLNRRKLTCNVVFVTSDVGEVYDADYIIPTDELWDKGSKVICDQPYALPKAAIFQTVCRLSEKSLQEIRKRVARSLGIAI